MIGSRGMKASAEGMASSSRARRRRWSGAGRDGAVLRPRSRGLCGGPPPPWPTASCPKTGALCSPALSSESSACSRRSSISSSLANWRRRVLRMASACRSVELERRNQFRFRFILIADDPDHLIEVQEDDQKPVQDMQPRIDLAETPTGAAAVHLAAVIQEGLQDRRLQPHHVRRGGPVQDVHVDWESGSPDRRGDRDSPSAFPARCHAPWALSPNGCSRRTRRGRRRVAALSSARSGWRVVLPSATSAPDTALR